MSATMTRQGGQTQLEQSDMWLALDIDKMAKGGFLRAAIEETQCLFEKPHAELSYKMMRGVLFPGHTGLKAAMENTRQSFGKSKWTADLIATMVQRNIPRHAGGTNFGVHLHQTDYGSQHQNWHHVRPERDLCQPVPMRELTLRKSKVFPPDMCIYMLLFPMLNCSILMHMPRIARAIKISIQICWLMKEYPLVSTLPAEWQYSWHPFCRRQQPFERTWQRRRALIEWNGIFECGIIYN